MKTMKKATAFILAAVLSVGVLSGCGKGEQGAKSNGKTLTIYAQTNGLGEDWLRNAAEAYQKKTGTSVEVEFDAYLSSNLASTLESSATQVADIYYASTYEWGVMSYKDDLLVDLTEFMNEKGEDGKSLNERNTTSKRYVVTSDGKEKQTIVPLEKSPVGLVYNKKMMDYLCHEELGWEEGHDYPINTKELREVMAALKNTVESGKRKDLFTYSQDGQKLDVETFVWSGSLGMLEFFTKSWIYQYLGEEGMAAFFNQMDNCDMLKDEAFYVAYQEMIGLLELEKDKNGEYYSGSSIPNCVSYNHTASQSQFLMNKALLCPTGSWFYSEMKATITDMDNIGFMPIPYLSDEAGEPVVAAGVEMPKNEDGEYMNVSYMNSPDYFVIPQRSQNQEEAKNFLRFMFSEEYMPSLLTDVQTPLAIDFDDSKAEKGTWYKEVENAMKNLHISDVFTGSKMQVYERIKFYYNPAVAPFSNLVMSSFGSSEKLIDSATGKMISNASEATGIAVTENVYNYVTKNHRAAVDGWTDALRIVGE